MSKKTKEWIIYVCPFCDKEQTSVIQWQDVSVGYACDLKTEESEEVDSTGGDISHYTCPECGEELPTKLVNQLNVS